MYQPFPQDGRYGQVVTLNGGVGACRDPGLGGIGYFIVLPFALGAGVFLYRHGKKRRKPLISGLGVSVAAYPALAYIWDNCL